MTEVNDAAGRKPRRSHRLVGMPNRVRRLIGLLIAILLGAAGAVLVTSQLPEIYRSQTSIFVGGQVEPDASSLADVSRVRLELASTYGLLATTSDVLDPVIDSLGLDMRPDELREHLSVDVPLEAGIIDITAEFDDPAEAARVANAVGDSLITEVASLEQPIGGTPSLILLTRSTEALPAEAPSSPNLNLNTALGVIMGGLTWLVIISWRTSRKNNA